MWAFAWEVVDYVRSVVICIISSAVRCKWVSVFVSYECEGSCVVGGCQWFIALLSSMTLLWVDILMLKHVWVCAFVCVCGWWSVSNCICCYCLRCVHFLWLTINFTPPGASSAHSKRISEASQLAASDWRSHEVILLYSHIIISHLCTYALTNFHFSVYFIFAFTFFLLFIY